MHDLRTIIKRRIFGRSLTVGVGPRHRRTSEGGWGLQPPDSGKTIIFRAKAKFFGQKPAAKNEKDIFVFIKRKKTEIIPSSKIQCPKSGIFTNNYWVG